MAHASAVYAGPKQLVYRPVTAATKYSTGSLPSGALNACPDPCASLQPHLVHNSARHEHVQTGIPTLPT